VIILKSQKYPNRLTGLIVSAGLVALTMVLSGCVSTALDIDSRAEIAIPAKVRSVMRGKNMTAADPVLIRIFKQESELEVWKRNRSGRYALLKTYPMCRWSGQLGPKKAEGDRQAPEGVYRVSLAGLNPRSQYFLSFDLGYPNKLERAKGYTGSALMVHGACSSSGCFAISDEYVTEVYSVVRDALRAGQSSVQVQSLPFRMTPENLAKHSDNRNFDFWLDLKEATTRFEVLRQPPRFQFCEGRYRFGKVRAGTVPENPLGGCPQFDPVPEAVGAKMASDAANTEKLKAENASSVLAYVDGGMHSSFRKVLANAGASALAKRTSTGSVPVSKPRAALQDPYTGGGIPIDKRESKSGIDN